MNTKKDDTNQILITIEDNYWYFKNTYSSIGLNEITDLFTQVQFCVTHEKIPNGSFVVLDFSNIVFWELPAVLWLVVATDHYKQIGLPENVFLPNFRIKIVLPKPNIEDEQFDELTKEEISKLDWDLLKSADFLRRWKIKDALKNLSDDHKNDPLEILFDDQKEYFLKKPYKFYKATRIQKDIKSLSSELLSLNLVEIRNLVDFKRENRKIERHEIERLIDTFVTRAVCPVLINNCDISDKIANKFITHLLAEGIENAFLHPNASIGMFSISRDKINQTLTLVIADNGDPIPKTIYPHYFLVKQKEGGNESLVEDYNADNLSNQTLGEIVIHATKEGVSRIGLDKVKGLDFEEAIEYLKSIPKRGEGLTHIRNCTTKDFGGTLKIETEGLNTKCTTDSSEDSTGVSFLNRGIRLPGNLVEIELLLKDKENTFDAGN